MYNSSVSNTTDLGDSNSLKCIQNDGNYDITINNLGEGRYCFVNFGLGIESRLECDKFSTMIMDKTGTVFPWFSTAGWFEQIAYCNWRKSVDSRYLELNSESLITNDNKKHSFKFYTHDKWQIDSKDYVITSNGIQFPFFYDNEEYGVDSETYAEYREKYKSLFAYLNTKLYNPLIKLKLKITGVNHSQKTMIDYWALCSIVDVNEYRELYPDNTIFNTLTIEKITDYKRYLSIENCLSFLNTCEYIVIETCEVMVRPVFVALKAEFDKSGMTLVDVHKTYVISGNYTSEECKQLEWLKDYHWVCDGTLSYAHQPYAYIDNWKNIDGGYNFDVVLGNCFLHYLEFIINSEDYKDDMYRIEETQVFVNFQQLEILLNNLITEGGLIDFIENQDGYQAIRDQADDLIVNQTYEGEGECDDIITESGDVAVNEDSMTFTEDEFNDAIGLLNYKYDRFKYKGVNEVSDYFDVNTKYDSKFYHNTKQGFYVKAVYNITCSKDSLGKVLHITGDTFDETVNIIIQPPVSMITHNISEITNGKYGNTEYKLFDAINLKYSMNGVGLYTSYSDLVVRDCHSKSVIEVEEIVKDSYGNIMYYMNNEEDKAEFIERYGSLDNVILNDNYIRDKVTLKRFAKFQTVEKTTYGTEYVFTEYPYESKFLKKNGAVNYDIQGNILEADVYNFYFLGHTDDINDILVIARTNDEQEAQKQPPFGFNDGVILEDGYEGGVLNFNYSIPLGWLRFVEHDFDYKVKISNKINGVEIYNSVEGDENTKNATDNVFKYSELRKHAKDRMSPRVDFNAWGRYSNDTIYTNKTPQYAVSGHFLTIEETPKSVEGYVGNKTDGMLVFTQNQMDFTDNTFTYIDYYNTIEGTIETDKIKELQFSATITPSNDVSNNLVIELV